MYVVVIDMFELDDFEIWVGVLYYFVYVFDEIWYFGDGYGNIVFIGCVWCD